MLPFIPTTATLDAFVMPDTPMLSGETLRDVKRMQLSIERFGLLNPLVVRKVGSRFEVVDGHTRMAAIRRMRFAGCLPRSLVRIPYILVGDETEAPNPLKLLSPCEQYEQVARLRAHGMKRADIATVLYAPVDLIRDLSRVEDLSPTLRQAFFSGNISLEQARAFSTLPNPDSQDALLIRLGPFASAPQIVAAIAEGSTVIEMGEDTLILPSRGHAANQIAA